jgi:predicted metal-binding membrane protein
MIAAMMLPSSLPLIRLFNRTAASQTKANVVRAAFMGGYVLIWTGFGALAFAGDIGIHALVDRWEWLADRTYLIAGSTLLLAGAFQFSDLKKKCLSECRNPGAYLLKHYRRGAGEAFAMGRGHGWFCLGCCWALMLVGFAVGVANLAWMAALTLIMLYEKTGKGGERGVAPIGIGLIALGVLVLLDPAWMPALFEVD